MLRRKMLLRVSLALSVLSLCSLFLWAHVTQNNGKRLRIRALIKNALASFERPPAGYPVTVVTRKREMIYFDSVRIEFVDAWYPEQVRPKYFRLETDSGGQLEVSSSLEGVTEFRVLALPAFSRKSTLRPEGSPQYSKLRFDPSAPGIGEDFGSTYMNPALRKHEANNTVEYVPLRCRASLTFNSGKILEGKVMVHHIEYENRVFGNTPEGARCLSLSDIDFIKLPKQRRG